LESLASVWARLDARRRMVVAAATLAMFGAVALMARGGDGEMALLYAGLDAAAAGEVVAALEARGVLHEVRGDAIWVPASARDAERMTLAAEGLPEGGAQGYELLDGLSGFGTTSQMFDAAYWRAKEGELARTILATPGVRAARVHISAGSGRPFRREDRPTAAVTVSASAPLAPDQAQALRHLVAAAVSGLAPADVAIIDGDGGLVADGEEEAPDARADGLRARALRLVEARVGVGQAVVELAVETVTETESIVERTVDPESRVAISTEAEESESTSQGSAAGAVTVASNLPDGDAADGGGTSSEDSESRTMTNYEVSEISREVLRAPGAVRRLTVAVLVNDVAVTDEAGVTTWTPRAPEELAALSELVGAAVGLDAGRGDVITVKSMPFERPAALGEGPAAATGAPWNLSALVRPLLLALVALALGLFVLRPVLRPGRAALALPAPPEGAQAAMQTGAQAGAPALALTSGGAPLTALARPALAAPGAEAGTPPVDPVTRLRALIEARQDETAQILRAWVEDAPKERA
jgi:flagellar M-ring protein FliF